MGRSLFRIFLLREQCSIISFLFISQVWLKIQLCDLRLSILKKQVTICRSFLKFNDCHSSQDYDGLLEDFRFFCCSRSRGSTLVLIHKYCIQFWQRETDSKSISTEYQGLIVEIKLLELLDPNIVSATNLFLTSKLFIKDFRLNLLKYDTWNAELPLCECGDYDIIENLVFFGQRIIRCAL